MPDGVKRGIWAKVIADSVNTSGDRLTTVEMQLPTFILAQLNTHRMFSRSAASSRAMPIEKVVASVESNPVIPVFWGRMQKGMVAEQAVDSSTAGEALKSWQYARQCAIDCAEHLARLAIHKQIGNRVLEPFLFKRSLVSGTDSCWANFFRLRVANDAQPEMALLAARAYVARRDSNPALVEDGGWHVPFVGPAWGEELTEQEALYLRGEIAGVQGDEKLLLASAARCARISYLTHDGKASLPADIRLAHQLIKDQHMSPFEHPAIAMPDCTRYANYRGWKPYRELFDLHSHDRNFDPDPEVLARILALGDADDN